MVLVLNPWVLNALLIEAESNCCLDEQFVFCHANNCKTNCLLGNENHIKEACLVYMKPWFTELMKPGLLLRLSAQRRRSN